MMSCLAKNRQPDVINEVGLSLHDGRAKQGGRATYGFVSSGETISAAPGVLGICLVDDVPSPHPTVSQGARHIKTNIDTVIVRRINQVSRKAESNHVSQKVTAARFRIARTHQQAEHP